jgi:hypothetical protein
MQRATAISYDKANKQGSNDSNTKGCDRIAVQCGKCHSFWIAQGNLIDWHNHGRSQSAHPRRNYPFPGGGCDGHNGEQNKLHG